MTRARRRALFGILVLIVAGIWLLLEVAWHRRQEPADRPDLMLLTSLPIVFSEKFELQDQGSPVLTALSRDYSVRPISTSSADQLSRGRLLLMAQPPAQSPGDLVALDQWVRQGGRVLLLADPMLEWPSERRLGDPLRPPVMFTDTGLLGHWGLRLDAPDQRGAAQRTLAGRTVTAVSPGRLEGTCNIAAEGFVAVCQLGKGRAVVVADADFLNAEVGSPAFSSVSDLLTWLSHADSQRTDLSTGASRRTS